MSFNYSKDMLSFVANQEKLYLSERDRRVLLLFKQEDKTERESEEKENVSSEDFFDSLKQQGVGPRKDNF